MANKYEEEAQQESLNSQLLREWTRQRIANIHNHVSIYDILRQKGVSFEHEDRPEQFSCPFHGKDNKPSARAFPATSDSPSHAWCYVCQERWDVIAVWKKFVGADKKFSRILAEIEQAFGLDRPAYPEGLDSLQAIEDATAAAEAQESFQRKLDICERRLVESKPAWKYQSDLRGYLGAASLLERVATRVSDGRMTQGEGETRLQAILVKIRERERECPAG